MIAREFASDFASFNHRSAFRVSIWDGLWVVLRVGIELGDMERLGRERELTSNRPWKEEIQGPVLFAEEFESEYEARGDG